MLHNVAEAAKAWAAQHPHAVELTTKLEQGGVRAALFSSTVSHIARMALGLEGGRRPDDVDLLVVKEDVGLAADLLKIRLRKEQIVVKTGDGHSFSFSAREGKTQAGSDEVQFVDPLAKLRCGPHVYDTTYTPHAASARTIVETKQGLLPLAHPMDTIAMYGILQRRGAKHDAHNVSALLMTGDPLNGSYAGERALHMGWDGRITRFIHEAGEGLMGSGGLRAPAIVTAT
ncbi:MAG TPA: hypothetical protein VLH38_02045 [Patescibacteria group bacterium]|nr:hypothetical protein [Patescibacteria group bacterium]